jgi:hypothetical protein|tara:strand:+ start:70 stop:357 length:288 start_codon:yes stop_codon:yes gene_type:complete
MTKEEIVEAKNFGIRNKDKSFSDIMYIAYDENKRGDLDLFFLEIMKSSSKLNTYFDKHFLEKSKLMLQSLYDNSNVIDKNLQEYLNNIEIGLKKF